MGLEKQELDPRAPRYSHGNGSAVAYMLTVSRSGLKRVFALLMLLGLRKTAALYLCSDSMRRMSQIGTKSRARSFRLVICPRVAPVAGERKSVRRTQSLVSSRYKIQASVRALQEAAPESRHTYCSTTRKRNGKSSFTSGAPAC